MIYGQQSASQPASQSVSQRVDRPNQPTNQPASQPARLLVGQALLVPFHVPRQSMQELSSLGRSSGPGSLLSGFASARALDFSSSSSREPEMERSSPEKKESGRGGGKKTDAEERRREDRGEDRGELLDRELVACSLKKNWKSVALDGPEDPRRGGPRGSTQLWGTVGSSASSLSPSLTVRSSLASSFLSSFSRAKRSR